MIAIGQVYRDAYPVNGRIRRFVVTFTVKGLTRTEVEVYEPRKRKPTKTIWLASRRFNRKHARGYVRVK